MNNFNKTQKILIIVLIIITIGIVGYYIYGRHTESIDVTNDEEIMIKEENKETEKKGEIMVHITGAVKNEGVYTLKENSRVTDAVKAAGGLTDDADMSKINLAYIIEDGIKIRIPSISDEEKITESEEEVENVTDMVPQSENSASKIVNINKANQTELETLPGIGPSTAMKIVNYREENGKFSSVEELKNISGIGESKFENIKDFISVK